MPVSSPKQTRQRLGILFSLPLFLCLVFLLFQLYAEKTDIHLIRTQNIASAVNTLNSIAKDAESSERGFLLTGEAAVLAPFKQAKINLPKQKSFLEVYENENKELRSALLQLSDLAQKRLDQTEATLQVQHDKGFAAAIDLTKSGTADATMDQLRLKSLDLLKQLSSQEEVYLKNQRSLSSGSFIFFVLGTILMIAVMYWLYNEVLSYIYARDVAQQQLEIFNADLQTMVDERTRDLVDANRELQSFAYVASHDLQEPLRTITSFTQLLGSRYQGRLESDADEFIGYIVTASKRMQDLINGLLQIAGLRKAAQPTARISFDKLLNDAEASLQAAIRGNDVRIERLSAMPELIVDRVQMLQVFQNLISNAIKYRKAGPPVIRIAAVREATEWTISVADNGRGFGQEFAERIFQLFQRLDKEVEGTGMGLSIARRIVERHGGRIWAESKPGEGATFFFALPLSLEISKPAPAPKAALASIKP